MKQEKQEQSLCAAVQRKREERRHIEALAARSREGLAERCTAYRRRRQRLRSVAALTIMTAVPLTVAVAAPSPREVTGSIELAVVDARIGNLLSNMA